MISCDEHCCCPNDLSLLVMVDGVARMREYSGCPISHFDECQAVAIEHDQVDFAATAVEVSGDGAEVLIDEKIKRQLLCLTAYISCAAESHGASSAASGTIKLPSSLMS